MIVLVKDSKEARWLNKVKAVATSESSNLNDVVQSATNDKGADVALNGLGASTGSALLQALGVGGRMAVYSAAVAGREMPLDPLTFHRKSMPIIGVNTSCVDAVKGATILDELRSLFEREPHDWRATLP